MGCVPPNVTVQGRSVVCQSRLLAQPCDWQSQPELIGVGVQVAEESGVVYVGNRMFISVAGSTFQ